LRSVVALARSPLVCAGEPSKPPSMAFKATLSLGFSGGAVAFAGADEVAYSCGNALVLQSLTTKAQVFILAC
jgi:hypothetical protein